MATLKSSLAHWLETQWWQRARPSPWLQPAASIYHHISQRHLQQRATRCQCAPLPLISIGNITAGGSGKTPFTLWLNEQLCAAGWKPIILCRGDGGKQSQAHWLNEQSSAHQFGDEAVLLHRLSGVPVMAAQDRLLACQHIAADGRGNIILLDDGFQYRHLGRSCDIVLIPAAGIGNGGFIPAGPLREPLTALKRADIIVRSHHQQQSVKPPALTDATEWQWSATIAAVRDWNNQALPCLQAGQNIQLISSIARPQRVLESLEELGFKATKQHPFADHHRYHKDEVSKLAKYAYPVTTAKDAVKLLPLWPKNRPLWVMEQQFQAESGLFEAITVFLNKHTPQ